MISATIEYALRSLVELAGLPPGDLRQGHDLAAHCDIPSNYMSKILWHLGKHRIVEAVRGARGGYRLARPAGEIRLQEVFEILDTGECKLHCLVDSRVACRDEQPCSAHHAWRKVHQAYREFLETMTIADISRHPTRVLPAHRDAHPSSRKRQRRMPGTGATLALLLMLLASMTWSAESGEALFQRACAACHSIGQGRRVGPDLKDVEGRRPRDWLARFIVNPKQVVDSGDTYIQGLMKEFNNFPMPVTGMDDGQAQAILDYIASSGQRAPSAPAPSPTGDPARGADIFRGRIALQRGGGSCVSCHALRGAGVPAGGGSLGPDLTGVGARLGGTDGLAAWLSSPPTPVMRSVFGDHPIQPVEVADLAACLGSSDKPDEPFRQFIARFQRAGMFAITAASFALAMLAIANLLYRRRIGSARGSLSAVDADGGRA